MNTPEIRIFRVPRNREQILRFAGIPVKKSEPALDAAPSAGGDGAAAALYEDTAMQDASLSLMEECLCSLTREAEGSIVFLRLPIERDPSTLFIAGIPTSSTALRRHLEGCMECLILAGTAGLTYDRLIRKNTRLSPAKALWYQAIGASAIESVLDAFCDEMEKKIGPLTTRFSPGYGDLPLSMQKDLFAVLKPEKAIGLTLNESLLMTPTKSVTAIIGIKG